jgi:hypothetical protein
MDWEQADQQHDQHNEEDEIHGNMWPRVKKTRPNAVRLTGGWGGQGTEAMAKQTMATTSKIRPGDMVSLLYAASFFISRSRS